jgi:hypothetical protein
MTRRPRRSFIRGTDAGRLGMIVRARHPVMKGHENLFVPLVLVVDYDLPGG